MADSTVVDYTKMKVVDLRKELKLRGLASTGDKSELVARLQAVAVQEEHGEYTLDSDEIDSDGVLEDEDEDKIQHDIILDEAAVNDTFGDDLALIEHQSDKSKEPDNKSHKTLKRKSLTKEKSTDDSNLAENKGPTAKKIVLNRPTSAEVKSFDTKPEPVAINVSEEKKVIITAEVDTPSRLEMRAKRFGLPMSEAERKEARKIRFGLGSGNTTVPASPIADNVDKLKKRAERFGQSVSKVMTDIENKERLEKRRAKFSLVK